MFYLLETKNKHILRSIVKKSLTDLGTRNLALNFIDQGRYLAMSIHNGDKNWCYLHLLEEEDLKKSKIIKCKPADFVKVLKKHELL